MADGKEIFMWIIVIFVIIVLASTIGFVIVKTPGQTIRDGGLDVVPVSEPPDPVDLTYDCQKDTDCKQGLVCDPFNYTCRVAEGSNCYHASDCKSGLICSGVCIKPDDNVDLGMSTFVDNRYVCNPYGLRCKQGAKVGDFGDPNGDFCCVKCQKGDIGCTPDITCGPPSSQDGYTLDCNISHRNCPCQNGKGCVPAYGNPNIKECRVLPNNPCVCSEDCVSRVCIYYADGNSGTYPTGICRGPVENGQRCTVNEGCISGNCSFTDPTGITGNTGETGQTFNYGYCQPPNTNNGETGAFCNALSEPKCNYGTTCLNNTCTAPNAFGLNTCDDVQNICGDAFFCASASLSYVKGATGNISINICGGRDNCICLYGNPDPSIPIISSNTTPNPIQLNYLTSQCMNGMSIFNDAANANMYCVPSVSNTPGGFMNSAPCLNDSNCSGGICVNDPAIYRFLPLTNMIFPVNGIQGLDGIYYEKIPLTSIMKYGTIKKIIGVSLNWSVNDCTNLIDPIGCQTLDRGTGDMIFVVLTGPIDQYGNPLTTIMYKTLSNGPDINIGSFVMDGGDPYNRDVNGWQLLTSYVNVVDFDAFWTNGNLSMYVLYKDTISPIYSIYSMYIDTDGSGKFNSGDNIKMPSVPNPGWNSLSCSDYHTASVVGSKDVSVMLSNGSTVNYCTNVGPNGTWTNIGSGITGKKSLGYGVYKDTKVNEYYGYPSYGRISTNSSYTYFSQPNLTTNNGSKYTFSKIQYPQNTYISNLTADEAGAVKPIVPMAGTIVSDYSIINVSMNTSDNIIRAMQFAYIAKWGSDDKYYVYYVGTGFSMALPTYVDGNAKVIITPGNLYIYSTNSCVPA